MSPPDERRPGVGTEATTSDQTGQDFKLSSRVDQSSEVAVQLRRRRAASYRCPVMSDRRRDTLSKPVPIVPTTVRVLGKSTEFAGPGVYAAIRTAGCKLMRARTGSGWWVPVAATEDVLDVLEAKGYTVAVTL